MTTSDQPASRTARAIAREQLTAMILDVGRRQLATVGPAQLSLRAIAREVGMVSSAVYRYFPSRDELLTELIIICFDEVGAMVEQTEAAVPDRADYAARWMALATTFRAWAVAHPYDYALLYGSPVPGYVAPPRTVGPASRVTALLITLVQEQHAAGRSLPGSPASPRLHSSLAELRAYAGEDLPDGFIMLALQAWTGVIGAMTLELFGHLVGAVSDHEAYFATAAARLAPVVPRAP